MRWYAHGPAGALALFGPPALLAGLEAEAQLWDGGGGGRGSTRDEVRATIDDDGGAAGGGGGEDGRGAACCPLFEVALIEVFFSRARGSS